MSIEEAKYSLTDFNMEPFRPYLKLLRYDRAFRRRLGWPARIRTGLSVTSITRLRNQREEMDFQFEDSTNFLFDSLGTSLEVLIS